MPNPKCTPRDKVRRSLALAVLCLASAAASPAIAQAKVGDRFGDWVFNCTAIAQDRTTCAVNQVLLNKETRQVVARFSVLREQDTNQPALIAVLPLGIDLTTGIMGAVDENDAFEFKVQTCTRAGCIAKLALDDAVVKQMKAGKFLSATFTARGVQEPVQLVGSLNGIADAMAAIGIQ